MSSEKEITMLAILTWVYPALHLLEIQTVLTFSLFSVNRD